MFRLAHISDPHLGPLPKVHWRELASKRVTGYINWQRHRGKQLGSPVLGHLMADLAAQGADHLVITGDLVNLGLEAEIDAATAWLEALGDPANVSVIPGNHEAYVPGALTKACRRWFAFMTGDEPAKAATPAAMFPYLRVRKNIALIGVSSAIVTSPFLARGAFRPTQARKLSSILKRCGEEGLFRVVMIHHPPVRGLTGMHKRLFGIGLFQRTVAKFGAELVLHGHTHQPTIRYIDGPDGRVPVVGVSSTAQSPGGRMPPSGYNLIEISGAKGKWNCILQHRAMAEHSVIPAEVEKISLIENGAVSAA